MHDSEQLVQEVLGAGAHGYILKDDADRNLVAAVDALRRHKPYLSPRVSDAVSGVGALLDVKTSREFAAVDSQQAPTPETASDTRGDK